MLENIDWLGHASFRIIADLVVYIDPWKIKEDVMADVIFITHDHYDHCSPVDIQKLSKEDTIVVAPEDSAEKLKLLGLNVMPVKPKEKYKVKGIAFKTIRAYNKHKEYHPKKNNWVGYVIDILEENLYFSGDTDYISEMGNLGDITIAFLPISGEYTMDIDEAVKATLEIHPKYVVPMHYGDFIGGVNDAEEFASKIEKEDPTIEVVIKEPEYGRE